MANWFDKLSQVANRVAEAATDATNQTIDKYKKEGFDGVFKTTQEAVSKGIDNTQAYLKDVGQSAKQTMKESEKNVGEGTLSGKIASGLSAVIHTTKIVSDDLSAASQKLLDNLNNLTKDENSIDKVGNLNGVGRNVDNGEEKAKKEAQLDKIPLTAVLCDIMKAEQTQDTEWVVEQNNVTRQISVRGNAWFDKQARVGDTGAISLLSSHLAQMIGTDYRKEISSDIRVEAIKILERMRDEKRQISRAENEGMIVTQTEPNLQDKAKPAKVAAKKTATKKPVAAKKTSINITQVKAEELKLGLLYPVVIFKSTKTALNKSGILTLERGEDDLDRFDACALLVNKTPVIIKRYDNAEKNQFNIFVDESVKTEASAKKLTQALLQALKLEDKVIWENDELSALENNGNHAKNIRKVKKP